MKSPGASNDYARLGQAAADLERLNRVTEGDFLAIGGKLAEFSAAARQISTDLAALAELISGGQGRQAHGTLALILERSREAEAHARTSGQVLAGVCTAARRIAQTFRGFRETVSEFHVLGSLTRIETARLGDTGAEFGNLAEEVNSLTQGVAAGGQSILEASSLLQQNMQSALDRVAGLRDRELKELPTLATEVAGSIGFLEERQRQAMEASRQQAAGYAEVSGAMGDLITALQSHDITRQQVEHVAAALRQLGAELDEGAGSGSRSAAALQLQDSQLAHAAELFAASAVRIRQDLEGIAGRVQGMAGAAQNLMDLSADEQNSFFAQLEARFSAIMQNLDACTQAEAETLATAGDLEESVRKMREAVAQVRGIEISMRRLAINAAIRAVQIGVRGHALSVLAEVMQRLAADSSGVTTEIEEALEFIAEAAHALSGGAADPSRPAGSPIHSLSAELHAANETSAGRMHEIAALSSRLGAQIESVRAGFSAGQRFGEEVARVRAALAEIAGSWGPADLSATGPILTDLAARYTMQAERDLHALVTAVEPRSLPQAAAVAPAVPEGDDFGANVELF